MNMDDIKSMFGMEHPINPASISPDLPAAERNRQLIKSMEQSIQRNEIINPKSAIIN